MVLKAFPLLLSKPVHEKTVLNMRHERRDCHRDPDAKGGDTGEEAGDEPQGTQKLGRNGQDGKNERDPHAFGKILKGRRKTIAAKPAQDLAGTMRKNHAPQSEP